VLLRRISFRERGVEREEYGPPRQRVAEVQKRRAFYLFTNHIASKSEEARE